MGAPTGILVEANGSIRGLGIAENNDGTEQPTVLVYFDLAGNDRYEDVEGIPNKGSGRLGYLDMGAYEFQCGSVPGDINCDGVVDFKDVAILCANWLAGTEPE